MPLIQTPEFRPDLHVEIVEGEGLFLLAETEMVMLSGPMYAAAASLIDGQRSMNQIAAQLTKVLPQISIAEAYFVLESLAQKQLIREADTPFNQSNALFGNFSDSFHPPAVRFTSLSSQGESMEKALQEAGINMDESAPLHLVLVDNYTDRRLAAINEAQLKAKQPWMLAKTQGKVIWLGPVFVPGQTGCYECLSQRLHANREVESYLERRKPERDFIPVAKLSLPSTLALANGMVATEVLRWLQNPAESPLQGTVCTLSLKSLELQRHILIQRPQCKACGNPGHLHDLPEVPKLQHHVKRFTEDGGHRTATPDETLAKYAQHISVVTGIVNDLSRLTPANDMIHSYHAGHNSANFYHNVLALQKGLRSKAGGKGKTDIQAKVSGLCEAVERYSGVFEGYEPRITASLSQLGDKGIHPNLCTHFSDNQFAQQEAWNKYVGGFHTVPKPYDPDVELEWSPVWSMTEHRYKYLPTAYLYFNYVHDKKNFVTWADSNGNASGNTLEEAILQGFLELVERDAVAIWWYNRLNMPGVDLTAFDDPWMSKLVAHHKEYHREVWALDLTNDLGIPVFAALTRRTDKPTEDILVGFGAHFDPRLALQRALTEINQFMPAVMNIPKEGPADYHFDDPHVLSWWKNATLENQPYLRPHAAYAAKRLIDYTVVRNDDILDDVRECQRIVESKGLEMLVQVQTRPDIGLPVAKVIVPGLRHFWARLGPGRLYDVPVQLGWLPAPLAESEMNPIPMFI